MNLTFDTRNVAVFPVVLALGLIAVPAGAQQTTATPTGTYVFSESGPALTALAQLKFANDGTITGQELLRTSGPADTYVLQGTYTVNATQDITLSLNAASVDATDAAGNPLAFSENVRLVGAVNGEYASLRTDPGLYATGTLTPASTAAVMKGNFLLTGKAIDPAGVSVDVVTLDGAGNVSGHELYNNFGITQDLALTGTYASQPSGFQTLTISGTATDSDGNTIATSETYAFLPTAKDIQMMRVDQGPAGIFALSQ